jgi:hypothetical protein
MFRNLSILVQGFGWEDSNGWVALKNCGVSMRVYEKDETMKIV